MFWTNACPAPITRTERSRVRPRIGRSRDFKPSMIVWVPNRSSISVTCDIAGQGPSGMIARWGAATAVSDLLPVHCLARPAGPQHNGSLSLPEPVIHRRIGPATTAWGKLA
jgi:hypothetical protein